MKLTIERAELLRALGHVHSVVERRTTIPIMSNVLLRAAGGELSFSATDMELEVVEAVAAEVLNDGAATAPAHTLYDIVRKLPDGSQILMEMDGAVEQLSLRAGRSIFRLGCLPVEDFPQISGGELPYSFTIAAGALRRMIDRTRFAISTEETRYYLNGIYLHAARSDDGDDPMPVLRAVATDGHRLARVQMGMPEGAADMPGVIIPRKTVGELRKLIEEAADGIRVSMSEQKIRFAIDSVVMTSKLIDGTFPDYQRVIPSGNDKLLEVDTRAFAAAVDLVATIATEKSRAVKLSLKDDSVTLSATSPEAGSASDELEASYSSPPLEIGFNSRYLLDATQQIEGDRTRLAMADAASPTLIRDVDDASALYVLMPMRV